MRIQPPKAIILAITGLFLLSGSARAELAPSFDLGYSAKHATQIVVVDGKGSVLLSWRGGRAAGDQLPFPANKQPIRP